MFRNIIVFWQKSILISTISSILKLFYRTVLKNYKYLSRIWRKAELLFQKDIGPTKIIEKYFRSVPDFKFHHKPLFSTLFFSMNSNSIDSFLFSKILECRYIDCECYCQLILARKPVWRGLPFRFVYVLACQIPMCQKRFPSISYSLSVWQIRQQININF